MPNSLLTNTFFTSLKTEFFVPFFNLFFIETNGTQVEQINPARVQSFKKTYCFILLNGYIVVQLTKNRKIISVRI